MGIDGGENVNKNNGGLLCEVCHCFAGSMTASACSGQVLSTNVVKTLINWLIYTALKKFGITWSTGGMPEYLCPL